MPPRRKVPAAVLEKYKQLRERGDLDAMQVAAKMIEEHPEHWGKRSNPQTVYSWLHRACQRGNVHVEPYKNQVPGPNTTFAEDYPEVVFPFEQRIIDITDIHTPYHYKRGMELVCKTIEERGIEAAVWGGDTQDNAQKGFKNRRDSRAATLAEGLHAAAACIDATTAAGIKRHVFNLGNHDDKPFMRDGDSEFTYGDWFEVKVKPLLRRDAEYTVSNRYYSTMEPRKPKAWPFDGPDNFPWSFTHQANYGKNQLTVGMELASIELANTVTSHQHHLAVGMHKSGLVYICDGGTLQDPALVKYKGIRHSRHPAWGCGFITVEHGVPKRWPFAAPDEWWSQELGA